MTRRNWAKPSREDYHAHVQHVVRYPDEEVDEIGQRLAVDTLKIIGRDLEVHGVVLCVDGEIDEVGRKQQPRGQLGQNEAYQRVDQRRDIRVGRGLAHTGLCLGLQRSSVEPHMNSPFPAG